jgi:hypothetical protein
MLLKIIQGPIIEYTGDRISRVGAIIHMDWQYKNGSPLSTNFHVWIEADAAVGGSGVVLPLDALFAEIQRRARHYVAQHYARRPEHPLSPDVPVDRRVEVRTEWQN